MIALCKMPLSVRQHFASLGLDLDKALFAMRSDFGSDGVLKDVFAVCDSENIYVTEGVVTFTADEGHKADGSRMRSENFIYDRDEIVSISEISEIKCEQLISTGSVVAVTDKGEKGLFNYTNKYRHDCAVFVKAILELKETGGIDKANYIKDSFDQYHCPKCGERYPDTESKVCPNCMDSVKLIKQLAGVFLRYKGSILMVVLSLAAISALGALTPYISNSIFYNDVLTEGGRYYGKIWQIVALMVGIRVVMLLVQLVNGTISAKVSADVTYDLKKQIFDAISKLSLSFFTNRQTGGLMTQINSDSQTMYWFFCDGFPYFVLNIVQLVLVFIIMLLLDPVLALYAFITVPVFFFIFKWLYDMFDKLHLKNYSRRRSLNSLISDVLNGMRVVKVFSREEDEKRRFDRRSRDSADISTELSVKQASIFPFVFFLFKVGSYIVWAIGGISVMRFMSGGEGMDYGTLMSFVAYFSMMFGPIETLADVANWWSECLNALHRLFQITSAVPEVSEKENAVDLGTVKGDVEFDGVCFSYADTRRVIDNVSFKVEAGHTLGIVGHTGAGKSTIVNLLARLYDVERGTIKIDGVDVRDCTMASLRKNLAIVSQETYLFKGSLLENIRYARPDATFEEVVAAAKVAGAHSFIIKYPDGYDTMIGFGHKELSGGERQRVSIARAILKDPRILILDEATAAMDTQTERHISEALTKLSEGRTTIIIAHRLSTLRDADSLIVIENGRVAERGTVDELITMNGVYYKLYKMQTEALKMIGIGDEAYDAGGPPHGAPPGGPPPQ